LKELLHIFNDAHKNPSIPITEGMVEDMHNGHRDKTPPKPPQPQAMLPMYLPYFKPATGCTNASDFIVRCLVV
jgi:hypothetical protein